MAAAGPAEKIMRAIRQSRAARRTPRRHPRATSPVATTSYAIDARRRQPRLIAGASRRRKWSGRRRESSARAPRATSSAWPRRAQPGSHDETPSAEVSARRGDGCILHRCRHGPRTRAELGGELEHDNALRNSTRKFAFSRLIAGHLDGAERHPRGERAETDRPEGVCPVAVIGGVRPFPFTLTLRELPVTVIWRA